MTALANPTILELVARGRRDKGDQPMLTFVDVGADGQLVEEQRSYADLWLNGSAVSAALKAEGMQPGQSFALIMHNHPEFVDAMVGSALAGTVYVPIDPRMAESKIRFMMAFADCQGAIIADYALEHIAGIASDLPELKWVWVLGTAATDSFQAGELRVRLVSEILAEPVADEAIRTIDPVEPMQMLYTSGTTGDPKAILATHARFAMVATTGAAFGMTGSDKLYTGLPLSHANAQLVTLGNALAMQIPLVISRRFSKSRLWEILSRHNCTYFNLLGGMTTAIFAAPEDAFDRKHRVRLVLSAGMPVSMWQAFKDRFQVEIIEFYGCAEGGLTLNPPGGPVGSIGKPPPGSVGAILDASGDPVPTGELGELCFRNDDGSVTPVNYYKNADASVQKTRGGWFHSGDIGWRDADGWYYFSHRDGDSIRRNGEFIAPADIERVAAEDPQVDDVFIYGLATKRNAPGEQEIVAAIVPLSDDFDAAAFFERCQSVLPANSVPAALQIVKEIPKTASQKPQRRILAEQIGSSPDTIVMRSGAAALEMLE